ncbi:hypothetical protein EGW08_010878, partial [Elysia chlorotica]
ATTLHCLALEYASGGELQAFIKLQKDFRLSEERGRPYIRQLVSALHYLHERGVAHRKEVERWSPDRKVSGAIHLDDCKAERMIPIYLLVAGCFGVARNLFSLVQRCRKTRDETEEDQKKVNPLESIVNCFIFAWFIAVLAEAFKFTRQMHRNKLQHLKPK